MSSNKFLTIASGIKTLVTAIATSTGASDGSKVIMTDTSGRIDQTLMPTGIGAATKSVVASEALVSGNFVNLHNNAGALNVRKADNSNGRVANGFVLAGVASGATAIQELGFSTGATSINFEFNDFITIA